MCITKGIYYAIVIGDILNSFIIQLLVIMNSFEWYKSVTNKSECNVQRVKVDVIFRFVGKLKCLEMK